jgi:hypothetical protein
VAATGGLGKALRATDGCGEPACWCLCPSAKDVEPAHNVSSLGKWVEKDEEEVEHG